MMNVKSAQNENDKLTRFVVGMAFSLFLRLYVRYLIGICQGENLETFESFLMERLIRCMQSE